MDKNSFYTLLTWVTSILSMSVGRSVRRSVGPSVRHTFVVCPSHVCFLVIFGKICIWLTRRASHMLAYDTYGWPEGPAIIARDSYLCRRPSLLTFAIALKLAEHTYGMWNIAIHGKCTSTNILTILHLANGPLCHDYFRYVVLIFWQEPSEI